MESRLKKLGLSLDSIAIFRNILRDDVVRSMRMLLNSLGSSDTGLKLRRYSAFVESLYSQTVNFSEYVLKIVFEDDNVFIAQTAQGGDIDPFILDAAENELRILQELSQISPGDITGDIGYDGALPHWRTCEIDFLAEYKWRRENIERFGYGKYSRSTMFILRGGETVPVRFPDTQRLSELYGYARERQAVIDNTLALLDGKKAQNVLLYGDAGTGKSSTVKAVVNEFYDRGLRLIEVTKEQLRDIPKLIDELSADPLKFIIFIDDLSFTSGEDCFGALKATLEGSVSARSHNTAIYATSNRRHLVKESFSDREGDDVHRNDTMQEMLSLSARFGLRVNFARPGKDDYISIAADIARQNGIELPEEELALRAEQFALAGSGRSPRTAKQFVDQLINER